MALHLELERRIAAFKKTEAAVVFQSGFAANAGTVSSRSGRETDYLDELNHASIIDGARLSRAEIRVFPHRDVTGLARVLDETKDVKRRLVITDGVFSMDGDIAPLPQIAAVARSHGAIMMIDDAHASGVLAARAAARWITTTSTDRSTFKSARSPRRWESWALCLRLEDLIEYLYHRARRFLSAHHTARRRAACLAAIDVLEQEPERIERLCRTRALQGGSPASPLRHGLE